MSKQCVTCREVLPLEAFGRNVSRPDGLQGYCRGCARLKDKRHYDRRRDHRRAAIVSWTRARRDQHAQFAFDYLADHPCVDCGEKDPVVLEFDHVRGTKRADVDSLITVGCSRAALLAEIGKCDVRCANCHRRRTAAARGYRRYRMAETRSRAAAVADAASSEQFATVAYYRGMAPEVNLAMGRCDGR